MGFDKFYDLAEFTIDEEIGMGLSDGSFFRQSLSYIKDKKSPFCAYLITLTNHTPYDIPAKQRKLRTNKTGLPINYLQSVRYTDEQIGLFIEGLRENSLLDNSIVVIYGDHQVFEFDADYRSDVAAKDKQLSFLNTPGQVPLIIYSPAIKQKEVDNIGGHVDLLPTLAWVMGIKAEEYAGSTMGRNLLTSRESFVVLPAARKVISEQNFDEKRKREELEAIDVSDLVIRSDYFGRH